MKRAEMRDTYDEMMYAQDLRLNPRQGEAVGTRVERASALQLVNAPTVDGSAPAVTLARVLKAFKGSGQTPEETERVRGRLWGKAQDAHAAMDEARAAYDAACEERAACFAELVAGGETYESIARMMHPMTRAAVHKIVKRYNGKGTGK